MFRTSGDIIKQLNNIYGIKFIPKYKNELKDRISAFSKIYIEQAYNDQTFFNKTILLSEDLEFDKTELKLFSPFFEKNKDELFNSFNPVWFNKEKNIGRLYSKKELNKFLSIFIYQQQENIIKDIFEKENPLFYEYNLNKILNFAKIYQLEEIETVVFKKIVDYIDHEEIYSFNDILYSSFEAFNMCQDFDEHLNTEAALIGIYYFSKTRELLLKLNSN